MPTNTPNGLRWMCCLGSILMLGVLVFACSEERATGPGEIESPKTFPALPVTEPTILLASDPSVTVAPESQDSIKMLDLVFPENTLASFSEPYDISLYLPWGHRPSYHQVQVYDYVQSAWIDIVPYASGHDCRFFWGFEFLLSSFGDNLRQRFLGVDNTLRVRGESDSAEARLLQYHPDYAFMAFPPGYSTTARWVAAVGDCIWAAVTYRSCDPDGRGCLVDSVFILDTMGVRRGVFTIPSTTFVTSVAEGDGFVWAITSREHIGTIDTTGVFRRKFSLREFYSSAGGIVWALDRLWVTDRDFAGIRGIRTDLSLDSGFTVFDWSIPISWNRADGLGPRAWDGSHFYVVDGGYIAKIDLTGTVIAEYEFPHPSGVPPVRRARSVSWDGAAIWAVHYDYYETLKRPDILTRIRMP